MYGYGTGGGDVGSGKVYICVPKTVISGGGDVEDDILKAEGRGKRGEEEERMEERRTRKP